MRQCDGMREKPACRQAGVMPNEFGRRGRALICAIGTKGQRDSWENLPEPGFIGLKDSMMLLYAYI